MNENDVDSRIRHSRITLSVFDELAKAALGTSIQHLPLIQEEVLVLVALAKANDDRVDEILDLVSEWVSLRNAIRNTIN